MNEDFRTAKRGGFATLATIALRNIKRNIRRTVLCIVAVSLAVFFTIVMQSMMKGMTESVEKVVQVFDTAHVNVVSADFDAEKEYMPVQYPVMDGSSLADLQAELGAIPGVRAVLGRVMSAAVLQDSTLKNAVLWGIDIPKETALNNFNLSDKTNGLMQGRFPAPDSNECAIGVRMAYKAGLKIGDRIPLITMSAQFSDKLWSPVITGIYEFDYLRYDEDMIVVDLGRLQRLLGLGEGVQQLFIFAEKPAMSRAIAADVRQTLGSGAIAHDWSENYFVAMMKQSEMIFVVMELVFLVVASFLIMNTVVMIIHERIKEIGMMGSLGMTRREIIQVFFFEALFLSVIGAFIGMTAGGIATFIMSLFPMDFNVLSGGSMKEMPMSNTIYWHFSARNLLQGFAYGVVIAGVCTLIPSLRSAFIEPVEALRR